MTIDDLNWATVHPSAYHFTIGPLRPAEATPRPHGSLRYRCPVTGSFVLLTDENTLTRLTVPRARLRCMDCGETHLLVQGGDRDVETGDPDIIVAGLARP